MGVVPKLASFYLKFWDFADNNWRPADNAPTALWKFLVTLPASIDRNTVHEALRSIAGVQTTLPDVPGLLNWFSKHPDSVAKCDVILSGKTPPKNLSTVLRNAYLSEVHAVKSQVQEFLQTELDKY